VSDLQEKVKWGILGCAGIVRRRFMPGMARSKRAIPAAIASRDRAKAESFASEFGIARACGSYDELLDSPDIEVVYIPLPNWLHAEWAIRAAEKGKHVLCEKPLAVDEKECRELARVFRDKGLLLMEGFMYRFHPRTLKAKEIVDSGRIGEVKLIRAVNNYILRNPKDVRLGPGGGALMDVGSYGVNAARYFFGSEPVAAYGRWRLNEERGVDIFFAGTLEFPGGRLAAFDCSFDLAYRQGYEIIGTGGSIEADRGFVPGDAARSLKLFSDRGDAIRVRVRSADQFALEIDHFSDCIRSGKRPMLDLETDAIPNMHAIDALRLSAQTGKRIEIG
jgi:D-xylose 1-dehydrogenase (NADP+, D-xylono-1,5-lactone-forming)